MIIANNDPKAPHRGFGPKAREILLGEYQLPLDYNKSISEVDLPKKLMETFKSKKESGSPKSRSSTHSIPEKQTFDSIGAKPRGHLCLSDVGKAQSVAEFKLEKRLLKTFQDNNIIRMPSMDSDNGPPTDIGDLCMSFEGIGKSMIYSQPEDGPSSSKSDANKKRSSSVPKKKL